MPKFFSSLLLLLSTIIPQFSSAQTSHFEGEWTKIGTTYVFEFYLELKHTGNQVKGFFEWKVLRLNEGDAFSESHYKDRIGRKGKEFVRGTYNATSKEYILKGHKKEDPHQVIGLDTYRIKVDENGDLGGDTSAGGTWQGRINGKVKKDMVIL